jgi:hypothetical protein
MAELNPDVCRLELERLGWIVEVATGASLWRLKAMRGTESWMYFAPSAIEVWDAALQMAMRHNSHAAEPASESSTLGGVILGDQ